MLSPFNFNGPGGSVFEESLQLAAAFLVDICQRDGRGNALHHFFLRFRRWIFTERGDEGERLSVDRYPWRIHARRTGGETFEPFSFALPPMSFHGAGGARGSGFWWISTLGRGAFSICMPACREGKHTKHFFIRLRISIFQDRGRCLRGDLYKRWRSF